MEERHRNLLVKQNPWWKGEPQKVPKFERDLLAEVSKYLGYKQIIAVVGLRRVGKTVLMKQIIRKLDAGAKNICYISFDDIDFQKYETAEELINYFLEFSDKSNKRYLFLDEVQKLPNWADLLKTYYDAEDNLKMFVSGSASLEIREHKETLAGRLISFHMPVLTFGEYARYFGMGHKAAAENVFREYDMRFADKKERYQSLFESYLLKGAFPELLETDDEAFIKKYIRESVIEKSVSDISRISKGDERVIYELLRLLAGSNAQLFEILNLSGILKVNRNTVSNYLDLLEKSFLIKVSHNFTASISKQVRASKKQYSAHSSIVIAMMDYPFDAVKTDVAGHLVEATVASSLAGKFFWRTPQKDEVDIVLDEKGIVPVEVKYSGEITKSDTRAMSKFCSIFKIKRGVIVTKHTFGKRDVGGLEFLMIPAWLFLLLDDYEFRSTN